MILKLYDFLKKRSWLAWTLALLSTALLVALFLTLSYKEDISDFLPLDEENQRALSVYQDISGANKVYAIIAGRDGREVSPDRLAEGVEAFAGHVEALDTSGMVASMMKEIDMEKMMAVQDMVYENIPYFLTDADWQRVDSLLAQPGFVADKIQEDKEALMFPSSGMIVQNIARDPLGLFSPVATRMGQGGMDIQFESYEGYILSPDSKRAIVIIESAFGSRESENNALLTSLLNDAAEAAQSEVDDVEVHLVGGPVIAVANAERIKSDSILAVVIAGILILALLIYVFRNARNILLILISVGWGWLFAMGCIACFYDSVSIIVIGIASVILGIAVNYPLHLIDHLKDSANPRSALKEIISPLVVGNVTTVGAFLCLVPLNAPALHDLGLFASLLLVGTIIFVLIFLPHAVRTRRRDGKPEHDPKLITRLASISIENHRWMVWGIALLTVVFGYFSLQTEFDSDMRNINYMTPQQREDMNYFQDLFANASKTESVYVVSNGSSWDEALQMNAKMERVVDSVVNAGVAKRHNAVSSFFVDREEQRARLQRWQDFISRFRNEVEPQMTLAMAQAGFSAAAFTPFQEILTAEYPESDFSRFEGLASTVFMGNLSEDAESGRRSVVEVLDVPKERVAEVREAIGREREFGADCFDVASMNGSIANTLSDDFNYIGVACGFIVFLFLWISLGSIELAIVSFLPMAVSWVWILGIMAILGIKFNIVNIILATFIFGQGDDYTIFMTEGLTYEHAYRRRLLASYKNSIVVSALIMFIGIGTLVVSKHPAMRSLGEVTVVGMLSVVLMAYLFPPLVFGWLVRKDGKLRRYPITLRSVILRVLGKPVGDDGGRLHDLKHVKEAVMGRYLYKGAEIERHARRNLKKIDAATIAELEAAVEVTDSETVKIPWSGQGEMVLVMALLHPEWKVSTEAPSDEERELLRGAATDFVRVGT